MGVTQYTFSVEGWERALVSSAVMITILYDVD